MGWARRCAPWRCKRLAGKACETREERARCISHAFLAAARYADAPFEAKCYNVTEKADGSWDLSCWFGPKEALKRRNALMNLPYIVDGDVVVSQSNACLVYLGEKFGLLGATPRERIECEQLLCEVMDLRNAMVKEFYGAGDLRQLLARAADGRLAHLQMLGKLDA